MTPRQVMRLRPRRRSWSTSSGRLDARPLALPLPEHHRFPIDKYALLRERVETEGVEVREADPVPWAWLEAVHDAALLERIRTGTLSVREQRGLGSRGRRSWSSAAAARSAARSRRRGARSRPAWG